LREATTSALIYVLKYAILYIEIEAFRLATTKDFVMLKLAFAATLAFSAMVSVASAATLTGCRLDTGEIAGPNHPDCAGAQQRIQNSQVHQYGAPDPRQQQYRQPQQPMQQPAYQQRPQYAPQPVEYPPQAPVYYAPQPQYHQPVVQAPRAVPMREECRQVQTQYGVQRQCRWVNAQQPVQQYAPQPQQYRPQQQVQRQRCPSNMLWDGRGCRAPDNFVERVGGSWATPQGGPTWGFSPSQPQQQRPQQYRQY
jgi:hypothetical protein